jgi:alkanesulfonate monooxygenase SsuD/methylene tetrahydromethanopterin reductase-like flavin-dependent oxidoreductase (luciferase family)
MLYGSKLDLLLEVNRHDRVTWRGPHRRRPLDNTLVVPRPEQPLRIWLGTPGSPESVLRAVELGLPMFLGILGGTPQHWAQYGRAYRDAWSRVGHAAPAAAIAVAVHGFVAENDREAKATYLDYETRMFQAGMAEIGRAGPPPTGRAANYEPGGMVFVGGPNEIADRILDLYERLGHTRRILQMDVGGMPQARYLKSIELLGTKVLPQIRQELEERSRKATEKIAP